MKHSDDSMLVVAPPEEKAILVGVELTALRGGDRASAGTSGGDEAGPARAGGKAQRQRETLSEPRMAVDESLAELRRLCHTAGLAVVDATVQRRPLPDIRTFVGAGKVEEIKRLTVEHCASVVVFDDPLSPAQMRNLEKAIGLGPGGEPVVKVLDRSQVILDIFAQRAQSTEGKLQVELAQLDYLLPRLTRHWTHLSRQRGGGVGTKGPGETQLETDRRRIRERVNLLRRRLQEVSRTRGLHRSDRSAVPFPTVALVGYTNAGKSTLMRALTGSEVYVDDVLFATLDATVRRFRLAQCGTVLLSDTVGFIHKLPHQLVDAFKSTLEEVRSADLLLHVMDASSDLRDLHATVVERVLRDIGASDRPQIVVWNKIDRLAPPERAELVAAARRAGAVAISASSGEGLEELRSEIDARLVLGFERVRLHVPHARGDVLARLHREGSVLGAEQDESGTWVTALLSRKLAGQIGKALEGGVAPAPRA